MQSAKHWFAIHMSTLATRLLTALASKPIELPTSVFLLGIGLGLPVFFPDQAGPIVGGILAGLGGILFSWSAARVSQVAQASEILRPQLETISQHLGSLSGQITNAIVAAQQGDLEQDTAFRVIFQANTTITGLVTDVQRLAGTQFDPQALISTARRLQELSEALAGAMGADTENETESTAPAIEPEAIREEFEALNLQLRSQLGQFVSPTRRKLETTLCPYCGQRGEALLGDHSGATSNPTCGACGGRYYFHRRADGTTFTRTMATISPYSDTPMPSPTPPCEKVLRDQGIRLVPARWRPVALKCLAKVIEESANQRIQSWEELEQLTQQRLSSNGYVADMTAVKKVRQIAYKCRVFDLHGRDGIGLLDGVSSRTIASVVNRNLLSRLINVLGDSFDLKEAAMVLFGGHPDGLRKTTELANKLTSVDDASLSDLPKPDPESHDI